METIKGRIVHATKTEAEWNKSTVVLLKGEVGFASDTQVIKVGNGKDLWKNLKSHQGGKGDPLTIKSTTNDSQGNTVVTFSDNTKVTIKKGETGGRGLRGYKGDSVTISSTTKDSKGNTVITFSDGTKTTINKGDKGDPLTFDDLTPAQIEQIKAKDVDLSNYATKDDLSKVDVSGQLEGYVTDIGVNSDGVIVYRRRDGKWYLQRTGTKYSKELALKDHKHGQYLEAVGIDSDGYINAVVDGKWVRLHTDEYMRPLAFKDHKHDEYMKKGDPIQLTSAQKAELKGERGATGKPGKDGQNGMITYIRYANNPSGYNMTATPQSDTTHIGIYTYEGKNAPTVPSVYAWTRIKGDPGTSITTWTGTQAQYDRIRSKSSTTLYIIKG